MGGGLVILLAGTLAGEWGDVDPGAISTRSAVAFAYLVLIGSIVGFSAFVWLLHHAPISQVATYAYVNPVVALVLGRLFFTEPVTAGVARRHGGDRRVGRVRGADRGGAGRADPAAGLPSEPGGDSVAQSDWSLPSARECPPDTLGQEDSLLHRRAILGFAAAIVATLCVVPAASAVTYPQDYAAPDQAWNVLAPGEGGSNPPGPNSFSQIPLYDGLTPNFDTVTDASLPVYFKKNVFGLGGEAPASTFSPPGHPGVVIERDSKGVAHITGATRADSMYGIGFVSIQDRVLLMEQLRGPSRLAAIDAPGIDPFQILARAVRSRRPRRPRRTSRRRCRCCRASARTGSRSSTTSTRTSRASTTPARSAASRRRRGRATT